MKEMNNLDANEPILRPHPRVEDWRNQLENKIRLILQIMFSDIFVGFHISIQFLALLISSMIEDIPAICTSSVLILITQGRLMNFMKPSCIKIVRCFTVFAAILGATLASSYAWRIYHSKKVYDYCTTYHTYPETLDILTVESCPWLIQRVFIERCMVFCGVMMVLTNSFCLLFCFVP